MKLLRLWFGLTLPVSRRAYIASGFGLMALKLAIDNGLAFAATGHPWPLAAYLSPSVVAKDHALGPSPGWLLTAMALIALPFLWVGLTMTVRRAADAGASPWLGLLFLVPVVNYFAMLVFAALPTSKKEDRWVPVQLGAFRQHPDIAPPSTTSPVPRGLRSALYGVLSAMGLGLAMVGISVGSMQVYGTALFFGTPFVMGLTTALLYNRPHPRSLGHTIGLAVLAVAITGFGILIFAIEGVLCLAMAAPLAAVLAILGALLGYGLSTQQRRVPTAMMLILPAMAGVESKAAIPQLREVATSVEVDAPPEVVWKNVVSFAELPAPPQWFFQLGIAYPMRARIQGSGVGAVRHCEFSTGPFVEPITVWDEPRRLAFDVVAQPPSMTELSPYRHVDAPHLEGYMVSRRGEFRLIPLPGGRTRLEGSTWYTMSIFPEGYWVVFGEAILHSIHGRVLDHVKHLSEADARR